MSYNTTSQFMDKQIMDLSNSESTATGNNSSNNDFIDFMNRVPEKKDDVFRSYDFMKLQPTVGFSSSPPTAARSLNFDSGDDDAQVRTWNSFTSRSDAFPIRNYSSFDAEEPAKFIFGKSYKPANASLDVSLVSEIDMTIKKYADNLMHAMDGVSARLSQLETRTCALEDSMDDLKSSLGNNHGSTDGKIRQLENVLRGVQTGVQFIRDKQEIIEAELHIANFKLVPKVKQENENPKTPHTDSTQPVASANLQPSLPPQQSSQPKVQLPYQFPQNQVPSAPQPETYLPPPIQTPVNPSLQYQIPPPQVQSSLPPQQSSQPQVQLPNQFPQNQVPSAPQPETYLPPPSQTPVNPSFQYQIPPPQVQPQQHAPPAPNQPPPQPQYSQPLPPSQPQPSIPGFNLIPPQPQYSQQPPPSQLQPSFPGFNPPSQPPLGHPQEEVPYTPTILPPSSGIASQQFYGSTPNAYESPTNRPGPGYSSPFGPSSGHGEPYPYSSSLMHYGVGSPRKPQQLSSPMGQNGGSNYANLPTARILPQALPTASRTGGGSGSSGSGNRVHIDDVIDKVTNMGFPRDQVRATVRKLTENGESVDLNVVLDKLMNDGNGQARGDWFGR